MAQSRNPAGDAPIPRHGGDLAHAARVYGIPPGDWLDLSTGINPIAFQAPPAAPHDLSRLPDADSLAVLLAAAASAYGAPLGTRLLAVPGAELAIRLLPFASPPGAVAVVAPTYGSHAEAWYEAGRATRTIASIGAVPDGAAIVVVGNPNNPDGRLTTPDALAALAQRLGARGGFLVVDEAFADVAPEVSLMPRLDGVPAVVLRSLGKFYGLPGLRLGFVAGPATILERLQRLLGDWPVSGPAIAIGQAALADAEWRNATHARLRQDMDRLHDSLDRHGLDMVGGTDLFVLIESERASAVHEGLAQRGIWTRAFDYAPTWLRIGIPPPQGFERLDRALSELG